MKAEIREALQRLPSMDEALRSLHAHGTSGPRWALLQALREQVDTLRHQVLQGSLSVPLIDPAVVRRRVAELTRPSLSGVINATGVVLHTNLGRAPLAEEALRRLHDVAVGYSNLEYELVERRRGSRHVHAAALLRELCQAEDAVVVNNNAAAVMLCLAALAARREVVVSRGELIEIGGSFRLPEVMELSGARLREVGTTNRTHLHDYGGAITDETALLLKVHRSNFAVVGFTAEVDEQELVTLGQERGVQTMFDLGSGTLLDLREVGLPAEPTVRQAVEAGFDLVTFSGDKLLGGPQAGMIVGRHEAVAAVRRHPLMRALRPDKLTLAALEATLEAHRDGQAVQRLPALRMLATPAGELRARAQSVRDALAAELHVPWGIEIVATRGRVGGGALPEVELPSWAVALGHPELGADDIEQRLRLGERAVIARIEEDRLLLDMRTIFAQQQSQLVAAVIRALR